MSLKRLILVMKMNILFTMFYVLSNLKDEIFTLENRYPIESISYQINVFSNEKIVFSLEPFFNRNFFLRNCQSLDNVFELTCIIFQLESSEWHTCKYENRYEIEVRHVYHFDINKTTKEFGSHRW